jgi:iron complex outermembrane receptor protein
MKPLNGSRSSSAEVTPANSVSKHTPYAVPRTLIASAIAGILSTAAHAQQAPSASADESNKPQMEEVVVTGSMLKRVDAETAEAVTILKADALKDQGITNVEQVLNTLTSANPSVNIAAAVGTFSGGGTYADLRGLGRSRTLILLDGQRLAVNAFDGQGVDLNGIPFSAIDSIEVLREGASALYGSDAIAGVINFKTKKNYQGGELNVNFDHPQEAGGGSGQADFSFGHGDLVSDGYNFIVTASYAKQQELQAAQRGFSAYGFDPARNAFAATNFPGSWPGIVKDSDGNLYQSGYPACTGNTQLTTAFGDCSYRYSAATDLLPQTRTISGMAEFTKRLPANNQVQVQYFWSQSLLTAYSGPMFYDFQMDPTSPYFPTGAGLICDGQVSCATPLNLSGVNSTNGKAQPVEAVWTDPNNSRYNGTLNVEQRVLLTFSGTNAGWDYTAAFNYSKNHNDNRNIGGYPNEDVLAPGGVLSPLINPFGPQTAAGQALINSSYINGVYELGLDTRWSVDLNASHELGDAFNAGIPASVAFGGNASGESFRNYTTPYNDLTSAATGLSDSNVSGNRKIQAAFIELDVPIAKSLDLDVSDRQDRYSDFGTTNNGKVKVRWQPIEMLTVRGSASTGFRAPTLFNLYAPPYLAAASGGTMGDGNPYCQPGSYNAEWTQQTCAAQGIGLYGGNTKLRPETSQNFDLGVVIQPIENLGITLDYYRILLKNTVSRVPASAVYGDPDNFASYITTATSGTYAGSLPPTIAEAANCQPYTAPTCGYINRAFANTGKITTDGFDLSVQYTQHTSIGTFREDLEGTAVTQFLEQQYDGGPLLNLVGNLRIVELNPAFRWQHNVRVDWISPAKMFGAGLSNRFYSGYVDEFPDGNGNLRHVGNYSLVDGYVSVNPIEKLTVLFGIKNLFNTSPPYTNASQNNFASGYNALIADPLLRTFYINLRYTL